MLDVHLSVPRVHAELCMSTYYPVRAYVGQSLGVRLPYKEGSQCCLGISNKSVAAPRQDSIHPCWIFLSNTCAQRVHNELCMSIFWLLLGNQGPYLEAEVVEEVTGCLLPSVFILVQ